MIAAALDRLTAFKLDMLTSMFNKLVLFVERVLWFSMLLIFNNYSLKS